jgi:exopolyphosphatase/guanosine-5'-triphosphate,3'-diphosphate pyrophosphatase
VCNTFASVADNDDALSINSSDNHTQSYNRHPSIMVNTPPASVNSTTLAAVDLGTNTLLMTIAAIRGDGTLQIVRDEHNIARLGEGVDRMKNISSAAVLRAYDILQMYHKFCRQYDVFDCIFVATSAMRDAANADEVRQELESAMRYPLRVISGEEEARLSFLGARDYPLNMEKQCTVIDIGGGSTEYITGRGMNIEHRKSLPLGAVRLFERYFQSLPPSAKAIADARKEIYTHVAHLPQSVERAQAQALGEIIGVGGTCTTLAAMDLELLQFDSFSVHNHLLHIDNVRKLTAYLCSSSLPQLLRNPAIHPQRADILPAGALILEESMSLLEATYCKVSTKGLRFGVLYDAVEKIQNSMLKGQATSAG